MFKNYAAFGQGTINVSERFRLIAGLRFTSDKLSVHHQRVTTLAGPGIQPSFGPFEDSTSNDDLSGKAGVRYDLAETSTAYATYSRGYKGPAYNVFYNLTATGTNVIDAETADSYEVGLKNTLLEGRLVLNLAAYYASTGLEGQQPRHGGRRPGHPLHQRGHDLDPRRRAGLPVPPAQRPEPLGRPGLHRRQGRSVQGPDQRRGHRRGALRHPAGLCAEVEGLAGRRLPDPRRGPGGRGPGYAQGSFQSSRSRSSTRLGGDPQRHDDRQGGLVDLSASITDHDDRYRLIFQVKNLFDTNFASAITSGGPSGSYRYLIPREADRYYGVTARANF